MKRILVTAALGNVGREVARACVERGLEVRVSHRDPAALAAPFPGLEAARLDFLDRSSWGPALAGCDAVFLLRPPPIGDMKATLDPFIDAAYAAGVEHVVFLSVAGADRMKWVPHHEVEQHLLASGRGWTVLRPGFFAQNLAEAYRRDVLEDGRLHVPAGAGRVAFLDVRDIGAVAARVFAAPERFRGQALTLTGPEAVTFDQVAGLLTEALGRPVRYQAASIPGYAWHLRRHRGLPWMQIVVQTILHVGLRRGDAEQVDPTVEAVLGRPPLPLKGYIERSAAAWRPALARPS
jgi:uncharacterized protein YbjT (DUF2867 family)